MNETCWVITGNDKVEKVSVAYRGSDYVITRTANGAELSHRVSDVFADEIHALRELNRRLIERLHAATVMPLVRRLETTQPWFNSPLIAHW